MLIAPLIAVTTVPRVTPAVSLGEGKELMLLTIVGTKQASMSDAPDIGISLSAVAARVKPSPCQSCVFTLKVIDCRLLAIDPW